MSISSTTRKTALFNGNGATTSFAFTFKVQDSADIAVYRLQAGVQTAVTTGFTVTLNSNQNSNPGGSVVFTTAPTAAQKIIITTEADPTQNVSLQNQGSFNPSVINEALDKLTIQVQQLSERQDRALHYPITGSVSSQMPSATDLALKALTFDANGSPVAGSFASPSISIASGWNTPLGSGLSVGAALLAGANNVFMPEAYGPCSATTDCRAYVQAAVDAAEAVQGTVLLSQQYAVASPGVVVDSSNTTIRGLGPRTGLVGVGTGDYNLLNLNGTGGNDSARAVTVNAAEGVDRVTLDSTTGLSVGEYLYFTTTFESSPFEFIIQISALPGSNVVVLSHALPVRIHTTDTHSVSRVSCLTNCTVSDMGFYIGTASGTVVRGLRSQWTVDTVFQNLWGTGLVSTYSAYGGLRNKFVNNQADFATNGGYPGLDHYAQFGMYAAGLTATSCAFGIMFRSVHLSTISSARSDNASVRGIKFIYSRYNQVGDVASYGHQYTGISLNCGSSHNRFGSVFAFGAKQVGNACGIWFSAETLGGNKHNHFAYVKTRDNADNAIQLNTNDDYNTFAWVDRGSGEPFNDTGTGNKTSFWDSATNQLVYADDLETAGALVSSTGANTGQVLFGSSRSQALITDSGDLVLNSGLYNSVFIWDKPLAIKDGITAPTATVGRAKLYVDSADGDLKIIFGDGTIKTIVTDT